MSYPVNTATPTGTGPEGTFASHLEQIGNSTYRSLGAARNILARLTGQGDTSQPGAETPALPLVSEALGVNTATAQLEQVIARIQEIIG